MDLVDALRKKMDALEEGDYLPGLRAVLTHVEAAFRHLARGSETRDETAFTDVIYRTNQAFEGSVKEAYRALAGRDPSHSKPFEIEKYLETHKVFSGRVLSQLTNYRKEWRNPSTHDHKLDFNESEAFLAIISVSAFCCLLIDQIAVHLAFERSKAETEKTQSQAGQAVIGANASLEDQILRHLSQFFLQMPSSSGRPNELHVIGSLHGYLSSVAPELQVKTEVTLGDSPYRADMVVSKGGQDVLVELKRYALPNVLSSASQLERYLEYSGIKIGMLVFWPEHSTEMEWRKSVIGSHGKDMTVSAMAPKGSPVLERLFGA